ncbi:MAG: hypothetical protein KDI73_12880 [Candidatus Competibacteraceae bacterium]|nr:hypothetical protein [Candidatus Competibacteraceae bacterium]
MIAPTEKTSLNQEAAMVDLTTHPPGPDSLDPVPIDGRDGDACDRSVSRAVRLDAVINVRLKRQEKVKLCEVARLAGLTVSAWARRRCLGYKVEVEVNWAVIDHLRHAGLEVQRLAEESGGGYPERVQVIQCELTKALRLLNPQDRT